MIKYAAFVQQDFTIDFKEFYIFYSYVLIFESLVTNILATFILFCFASSATLPPFLSTVNIQQLSRTSLEVNGKEKKTLKPIDLPEWKS